MTFQDIVCDNGFKKSESIKTREGNILQSQNSAERPNVQPNVSLKGASDAAPLLALYRRWADAERLAFSTSRIALAMPIANLQALKREVEAMDVPSCLNQAKGTLDRLIGKSNEAVLQFAAKEEVTSMVYTLVERPKLIPQFEREVTAAQCSDSQ
ncbi:hypothetical protein G7047_18945 [Diaphorobacter sp. HDW4A]|uniref:hypothetical protein n=1 Tax=Diaphorobacter sp. HDW4A TaxID=2714924 RepID=UPI00140CE9BD|nr:hypothetical protein [Diaphorobacter sp. HDW4A]QIL81760.1 hypothetical protein G7047_18945 [Diaphorobacter sp. HDW4A]